MLSATYHRARAVILSGAKDLCSYSAFRVHRVHTPIRNFSVNVLPCSVIHYDNSRATHGMNQPKLSILGFSCRKRSVTRLTRRCAVSRPLQAANRRQVTATIARICHFLLDTNGPILPDAKRPSLRILSRTISLPHPCAAAVPSNRSSLATSHRLFHETLNRQPVRSEIALTPRKQTTVPRSNRQLSRSYCTARRMHRVKGCGPQMMNLQLGIRSSSPRLTIHESQVTNHESHS